MEIKRQHFISNLSTNISHRFQLNSLSMPERQGDQARKFHSPKRLFPTADLFDRIQKSKLIMQTKLLVKLLEKTYTVMGLHCAEAEN